MNRGVGGKSRFSLVNFLSHSAEKFRRKKSFGVSLFSGVENFGLEKAGENQSFPSKNFCLTVTKLFAGEPFCAVFQKISGSKKVFG